MPTSPRGDSSVYKTSTLHTHLHEFLSSEAKSPRNTDVQEARATYTMMNTRDADDNYNKLMSHRDQSLRIISYGEWVDGASPAAEAGPGTDRRPIRDYEFVPQNDRQSPG